MTKNRTIRKRRTIHIIDDNSGKKTFYRYVRSPKKVTCKRKKKEFSTYVTRMLARIGH